MSLALYASSNSPWWNVKRENLTPILACSGLLTCDINLQFCANQRAQAKEFAGKVPAEDNNVGVVKVYIEFGLCHDTSIRPRRFFFRFYRSGKHHAKTVTMARLSICTIALALVSTVYAQCGSGTPDARVTGSGSSFTATKGSSNVYSGSDYRAAIQAALDRDF